jgi:hypothetical protein
MAGIKSNLQFSAYSRRRVLHRLLVYLLCPILTHITLTLAMPEAHSGGSRRPSNRCLIVYFGYQLGSKCLCCAKFRLRVLADAWAYCPIRLNPVALLTGTVALLAPRITANPLLSGLIPPLCGCAQRARLRLGRCISCHLGIAHDQALHSCSVKIPSVYPTSKPLSWLATLPSFRA